MKAAVLMQSGAGMVPMFVGRAPHQWQQITAFLDAMPKHDAAATGKRSAGAAAAGAQPAAINFGGCVAPATTVPDGNHGDNFEGGRA